VTSKLIYSTVISVILSECVDELLGHTIFHATLACRTVEHDVEFELIFSFNYHPGDVDTPNTLHTLSIRIIDSTQKSSEAEH
jgi:hypothetical protein